MLPLFTILLGSLLGLFMTSLGLRVVLRLLEPRGFEARAPISSKPS